MSDEQKSEMIHEDRLKAIAYQFIALYERWSEDRQVAAKQGADTSEIVAIFVEQVKSFKQLESNVRQQIINSIQNATLSAVKTASEEIKKEASVAVENTVRELTRSIDKAQHTLEAHQQEIVTTHWKIIGATVFTTVITCLLIVKLLIHSPTLPLTNDQISALHLGQLTNLIFPKLSKQEQDHWLKLTDDIKIKNNNDS